MQFNLPDGRLQSPRSSRGLKTGLYTAIYGIQRGFWIRGRLKQDRSNKLSRKTKANAKQALALSELNIIFVYQQKDGAALIKLRVA